MRFSSVVPPLAAADTTVGVTSIRGIPFSPVVAGNAMNFFWALQVQLISLAD
jgi:hypothetical protein